jgi:cytochrome c oxidase assembly protein subunit 11
VSRLLFGAAAMFAFGFALVPLYDVICDITGLNGRVTEARASDGLQADEDRTITVEFVASLASGMPWEFRPQVSKMQIHPGKAYRTSFSAHNLRQNGRVAQAVASVAPGLAARHLIKSECFCFTRQEFSAGEQRDMPVVFMVAPELPRTVETVTLSYTFFELDEKPQASLGNSNPASKGEGA